MKRNIFSQVVEPLEIHKDKRGLIVDIFYKSKIDHVAYIVTKKGEIRGNHYHKETIQHTLILKGSVEYWERDINSKNSKKINSKDGDIIFSAPNTIHAFRYLEDSDMIVFTEGPRGGKNYEQDTFRVDSIID